MLACGCGGPSEDGGPESLLPYIDLSAVSVLNEETAGSAQHVFKVASRAAVAGCGATSPAGDALLVFKIPFTCAVKVRSIAVGARGGGGGLRARLLVNAQDADADAASEGPCAQELTLGADGAYLGLRPSKFNAVHHLTVAVLGGGGAGAPPLEVYYVGLQGEGTGARAVAVHAAYEARAQAADHAAAPTGTAAGGLV